jgi:UDP-N-acetylmuramoyl-L-alanyl-D-glutamate--2,6-diaminopimelate ligase
VVGVTFTNGKSTTTSLLAAVFDAAGRSAGVLGTVHYRVGTEVREAARTTPESSDLQALLRQMIARGNRSCVMEVSSHALALRRVDGLRFAAGVFTNLTRDHLDFHADMEAYFAAKRRLFEMLTADAPGVINADEARAPALTAVCARPITYGIQKPADVRPEGLEMDLRGVRFAAATPSGRAPTSTTCSPPPPPRRRCRCRRRRLPAGCRTSPACQAASRWCRRPPTTSPWSSTTPTPTTRCATCWRPRAS